MGLINKSQVKAFFRRTHLRINVEVYERIENRVQLMLVESTERAVKNKRTTVMEADF